MRGKDSDQTRFQKKEEVYHSRNQEVLEERGGNFLTNSFVGAEGGPFG